MDSTGASVSLDGSSTTATAADSSNAAPHYLRPFTGSCHDICKFGRRRALDEQTTKPLPKATARVSMVVPSHRKKATARLPMVVPLQATARLPMVVPSPSPSPSSFAKSFSMRTKGHSLRRNTSPGVKRGLALARVQVKESGNYVGSRMSKQRGSRPKKPARVEQSPPMRGRRRRNEDVQSGGDMQSLPSNTATVVESLPPTLQEEDGRRIKMPRTKTESNGFEFEFEPIGDAPSPSSHGEYDEESDKLVSDTTTMSQTSRNSNKRRRSDRVVKPGDNHNHNQAVKMKFRVGKTMHPHKGDNAPRRHKFRAVRMNKIGAEDSTSDSLYKPLRTGPPSTMKDKHGSGKSRHRRVRCGKARIVVLEDRRRDPRKKDAHLFNYVIEETASKLAERRKGTVKSLVGAFETLISHQESKCVFQLRKMKG